MSPRRWSRSVTARRATADVDPMTALRADIALRQSSELPPPERLREEALQRALERRRAGRPTGPWASQAVSPDESFRRTVDELAAVLADVTAEKAALPAPTANPAWSVRDVVAHLIAVESHQATSLGIGSWAPPAGMEADHRVMTEPTIAELRAEPWEAVFRRWREATDVSLQAVHAAGRRPGGLDERTSFAGLPMRVGVLLVVRTFEVWTHTEDILRAVGRPLAGLDGSRLALMSDLAVRSLPLGMALAGRTRANTTARIVLTGPGGGAWSQSLSLEHQPGDPDLLLVADVVSYCRLAAQRVTPAELNCYVEGDERLAEDVLVGQAIFAA